MMELSSNLFKFLLFLTFSWGRIFGEILRTNCKNEGTFSNVLIDKALDDHVIRSITTTSAIDCAFHCIPAQRCLSYNYVPTSQSCELNNATRATKPASLKNRPGTTYYDTGANTFCHNGGTLQGQCLRHHHVICSCTPKWTGDDCSLPKLGTATSTAAVSCRAINNAGDSVGDTNYWMKPIGVQNSFNAYCSMSHLGTWKKVTLSMFHSAVRSGVTISTSEEDGALKVTGTVGNNGCGGGRTGSASIIYIKGFWTKIKYKQKFTGVCSCWRIFGNTQYDNKGGNIGQTNHGLIAFDKNKDTVTDQRYMAGFSGHAFSGTTKACSNVGSNFWDAPVSGGVRYATVTLRRNPAIPLAGIFTGTSCGIPSYTIKNIYVYY